MVDKERREFNRAHEQFQSKYRLAGELGESWKLMEAINISASGMRFMCDEMLDPGTHLELQVTLPVSGKIMIIRATAVWSRSSAAGVAETGIQFDELGPDEQFHIDQLVSFLGKSPRSGSAGSS